MIAAELDIRWIGKTGDLPFGEALVRHIAPPRPQLRCPTCQSILYSRRHKLCGVCGEALPEHFLFSGTEASRVERLLSTEREKHRAWMNKAHWE